MTKETAKSEYLENDEIPPSWAETSLRIRDAEEADLPRIVEIYNESVPAGWSTADTRPISVESRREWFARRDPRRRPIWVAEAPDRTIAGWVSLTSFYHDRPAYDATAEVAVYVGKDFRRRGVGRLLKRRMIERCPEFGVTTLISMHFDHNDATAKINADLGFEEAGWLKEIAIVAGEPRGLKISLLRIEPT